MAFEEGLRTLVLSNGSVAGLIGTRLYPNKLPQSPTYPAVVYERVGSSAVRRLGGGANRIRPRIRFHCWAETYGAAKNTAEALRDLLDGYRGAAGAFQIDDSTFETDIDDYDDDAKVHRVIIDFRLSHPES